MKRSVKNRSLLLFLLLFSLSFLPGIAPPLYGQWQIETAGDGRYGSIDVDAAGKVYIAYINSPFYGDVVVAVRENGQWSNATLTGSGESNAVSLVLDNDGWPHLIYAEANTSEFNFRLKHIANSGTGWSAPETIVTTDQDMMAWSPTMRIDKNNKIHITYLLTDADAGTGEIYYLTNSSGDWESTQLNQKWQNPALYDVSMVLDSEGYAHVVSYFSSLGGPGYMTNAPAGQWTGPQLIQLNWYGGQLEGLIIDISMDPENHPHVSYVGSYDGSAVENHMYAAKTGSNPQWDFQQIDEGSWTSAGNAIACDPQGVEHIAYYHLGSGELRYSMNFSGSWPHGSVAALAATNSYWLRRVEIVSDKEGYVHISYQDDDKVFYATNRIELPAPNIVLSPASLAFGTVDTGQVATRNLYIKNEGVLDLHLSDIALSGGDSAEFSLDHLCEVIVPDDSCAVQVRFEPVTQGEKQTTLKISSDDPDTPVTGAAITGRTPYPVISVEPLSLEFDAMEVGESDFLNLSIENVGDANLRIDSLKITGDDAVAFSHISACTQITQSASCDLEVIFKPEEVGTHTAILHIYSNDPENPVVTVNLVGRTPAARMDIQTDIIDFGAVPVGNLATAQLLIENSGERQLNISSVSIGGTDAALFRSGSSCGTISPGGSCVLNLTFYPASTGMKTAVLSISSNDPDRPVHPVMLMGTAGEIQSFSSRYGGDQRVYFYGLDTLSTGEFIVTGKTDQNGYLAALSSRGEISWQKEMSSGIYSTDKILVARETWDQGLIIAGRISGNYRWIARLDAQGEFIWQKRSADDYWGTIRDLKVTPDSGFIVSGETWNGPADPDMWIGKMDSTGAVLWQKTIGIKYGGANERDYESGMTVLVRPDGSFIVAGSGTESDPTSALLNHPDGGYLYGGDVGYLWKFSSEGDVLWQKDMDVYTASFWLGHFSPSDELLWSYEFPQSGIWGEVYDLSLTADGNILALASARENLNVNMMVLQLSNSGNLQWAKRFGYPVKSQGYKVLGLPGGEVAFAGYIMEEGAGQDNGWFGNLTPEGDLFGCASGYMTNADPSRQSYSLTPETVNLPVTAGQVEFIDAEMSVSEGNLIAVDFCTGITVDIDRDGVTDEEESGPDGLDGEYDGNSDGLPDSRQANVASLHSFDGSEYLCLETATGLSLQDVSARENPSPDDQPEDFVFEMGFFEFSLLGLEAGGDAALKLLFTPGYEPDTYYKYAPTADNTDPHWYEFLYDGNTGAEISSGEIILHFTDGERGDEDLLVNGEIKDIGGPARMSPGSVREASLSGNPEKLIRVYPNPSAGMATVYLDLPQQGHILVECYDLLGKKTGTLADRQMSAGRHALLWDTGSLPAGNYFILVRTDEGVASGKVVIIR